MNIGVYAVAVYPGWPNTNRVDFDELIQSILRYRPWKSGNLKIRNRENLTQNPKSKIVRKLLVQA